MSSVLAAQLSVTQESPPLASVPKVGVVYKSYRKEKDKLRCCLPLSFNHCGKQINTSLW